MWIFLITIIIYISILLGLIFIRVKDSAKRYNNALLIFYFAVSLWILTGLSGIYSQVYSIVNRPAVKESKALGASKRLGQQSNNDHYWIVMWGLIVLSGVYVVRRPEWANLIIEGLAAWKGKDIDRSKEILIQHAISNPNDRDWVEELLIKMDRKNENTNTLKEQTEPIPKDVVPR